MTHFTASDKVGFRLRFFIDGGKRMTRHAARSVREDDQVMNSRCSHEIVVTATRASSSNHIAQPPRQPHLVSSSVTPQPTCFDVLRRGHDVAHGHALVYNVRDATLSEMNPRTFPSLISAQQLLLRQLHSYMTSKHHAALSKVTFTASKQLRCLRCS